MTQLTASPTPAADRVQGMTYARSRLWLGITSVGFFVVLATILLSIGGGPAMVAALGIESSTPAVVFLALLGCYLIAGLPGDFVGGYWLPRRFGRSAESISTYLFKWCRGVLTQLSVMFVAAVILLQAGRMMGTFGFVAAAGLLMLALVQLQLPLARLAARINPHPAPPTDLPPAIAPVRTIFVDANDDGFVGGFTGLPGFEKLVVPAAWTRVLTAAELEIQLRRRAAQLVSGTRTRGVVVGIAWNLVGLTLAAFMPGSAVDSASGMITISLWFTIWSFLGLLILPTTSRRGVYEADRQVLLGGISRADLEAVIRKLDRLQEDEPQRPSGVEAIFHPVPSVENRLSAALQPGAGTGAYHVVRMALPTSWCCLGFLSRAVHCNCGRPAVWVMLPGD